MLGISTSPMLVLWMETALFRYAKILSRGILMKTGPVTETEVFDSAGALVKEMQAPSRPSGHVKSRECISRGVEQYTRQYIL